MKAQGSNLVSLHIGDADALPPYSIPVDRDFQREHSGFHRYCDTFGIAELRCALAEKLQTDNGLDVTEDHILITAGATNALNVAVQSIVDPGDDVLLLSPYWPFFRGMVGVAGGRTIEAPLYTTLYETPDADVRAILEEHRSERTIAVYLNSPNNPSGKVLSRCQLEVVADFVQKHNLWLISDEAYDGMTYDGHEHISPASLPGMLDRTISIFTFSKVYMFSGLRIGYAVCAKPVVRTMNKIMVHQIYSPSTIAQQMMVEPVRNRRDWSDDFVRECARVRDMCASTLDIPAAVPDGAYYFFFDIRERLRGRDYQSVINACFDAGVSVAPGADFGADFGTWIRICFAGEPADRVMTAVERLNAVLV